MQVFFNEKQEILHDIQINDILLFERSGKFEQRSKQTNWKKNTPGKKAKENINEKAW